MQLTFLGTSAAFPLRSRQTCFIVADQGSRLLVDTMGGYDICRALRSSDLTIDDIGTLFITHRHIDHALGFLWIIRMLHHAARSERSPSHRLVVLCTPTLRSILVRAVEAYIPDYWAVAQRHVAFELLHDGTPVPLHPGITLHPLDLRSDNAEQVGFLLETPTTRLAFTGDEPLRPWHEEVVRGVDGLIHEAFCLEADEQRYGARAKHHSTVLDAARHAARVDAKALILTHMADEAEERPARFAAEAATVFDGPVHVPVDGETIML